MQRHIIYMYHDVYRYDKRESGFQNATALKYKVSVSAFENQVAAIVKYLHTEGLPTTTVEFTFDDGGVSFITEAAPILEKYGFKGIFYVSTQYIGTKGFLNEEQIRELYHRGHIIGNHSHSHPEQMSTMSDSEIKDEWKKSQACLNKILNFFPVQASIPNGYSSNSVLKEMKKAGIKFVDTSVPTIRTYHFDNIVVRGRYVVTDSDTVDSLVKLIHSPFIRFCKISRYHCLSFIKAILGNSYLKIRKILIQ